MASILLGRSERSHEDDAKWRSVIIGCALLLVGIAIGVTVNKVREASPSASSTHPDLTLVNAHDQSRPRELSKNSSVHSEKTPAVEEVFPHLAEPQDEKSELNLVERLGLLEGMRNADAEHRQAQQQYLKEHFAMVVGDADEVMRQPLSEVLTHLEQNPSIASYTAHPNMDVDKYLQRLARGEREKRIFRILEYGSQEERQLLADWARTYMREVYPSLPDFVLPGPENPWEPNKGSLGGAILYPYVLANLEPTMETVSQIANMHTSFTDSITTVFETVFQQEIAEHAGSRVSAELAGPSLLMLESAAIALSNVAITGNDDLGQTAQGLQSFREWYAVDRNHLTPQEFADSMLSWLEHFTAD